MIEIDGSYGEGGGSIIRAAVGLSAVTGKPIRIMNIRKGRQTPGLREQHLQGILAVADFCSGKLKGAELGSTEIEFYPGNGFSESVKIVIGTAGSVGLALQPLQIAVLAASNPVKVEISGGATYGKWAPPIDFMEGVFYKVLGKAGYRIDLEVKRHGFYPSGGARVSAVFHPPKERNFSLNLIEQGKISSISGLSVASKHLQNRKVAERQKIAARQEIFNQLKVSPKIKTNYLDTESIGSAITLSLTTQKGAILGAAGIGEQKLRAEVVGKEVSQSLISDFQAGAAIDRHSLDQIIPILAASQASSVLKFSELTSHARTNIWVCEQFFGKIFNTDAHILTKKAIF